MKCDLWQCKFADAVGASLKYWAEPSLVLCMKKSCFLTLYDKNHLEPDSAPLLSWAFYKAATEFTPSSGRVPFSEGPRTDTGHTKAEVGDLIHGEPVCVRVFGMTSQSDHNKAVALNSSSVDHTG